MITVVKAGALSTVQDLGREGFQAYGVSVGGAVDTLAVRVANRIVGNAENSPVIECTLTGPVLEFQRPVWIALVGATVEAVPRLRPLFMRAGARLSLETLRDGARTYVAVAGGGVAVPMVFGSAATHLSAGFGGHEGRALKAGDRLKLTDPDAAAKPRSADWSVSPALFPPRERVTVIRALPGRQAEWFAPEIRARWLEATYAVTAQSNRMGLRLSGPELRLPAPREMISEAVAFGSVQVPPDGHPIVLLSDRQTLGGYPKIADVIAVDLPRLAQLRPGDAVRFQECSLGESHALLVRREAVLASLWTGLEAKRG